MPWKVEQKNEVMNSRREMMKKKNQRINVVGPIIIKRDIQKEELKNPICIENQRTHMSRLKGSL